MKKSLLNTPMKEGLKQNFILRSHGRFSMRMWMINPALLCSKHLLGEHGEIHKHRHCFVKCYSIAKRISPIVQICPSAMQIRHDELVQEMLKRGYNHASPYVLPDLSYLSEEERNAKADTAYNLIDLISRCKKCEERIQILTHN